MAARMCSRSSSGESNSQGSLQRQPCEQGSCPPSVSALATAGFSSSAAAAAKNVVFTPYSSNRLSIRQIPARLPYS